VRTLAGAGVGGASDGVGSGALFRSPSALAAAPGDDATTLWVADSGNHRLRRVNTTTGAPGLCAAAPA
jgi:hypothetical protein